MGLIDVIMGVLVDALEQNDSIEAMALSLGLSVGDLIAMLASIKKIDPLGGLHRATYASLQSLDRQKLQLEWGINPESSELIPRLHIEPLSRAFIHEHLGQETTIEALASFYGSNRDLVLAQVNEPRVYSLP